MNYKKIPYVEKEISPIVFGTATKILFDAIEKDHPDIENRRQKMTCISLSVFTFSLSTLHFSLFRT